MFKRFGGTVPLLLGVALAISALGGCSAQTAPAHRSLGDLSIPVSVPKANGEPISLKSVPLRAAAAKYVPEGVRVYSLVYWSRGERCQAYLDVPAGSGSYPLLVELHGGIIVSGDPVHYTGYPTIGPLEAAVVASTQAISYLPNYVGYGSSQGTPGDPYQNYRDVVNGLAALGRISGLHVLPHATYLWGFSMGGDVAMILAAHDPDVRAAELVSPYPGPVAMMKWMNAQTQDALGSGDLGDYATFLSQYGQNLSAPWYQENSYSYSAIQIPVLIIGGTKDQGFPPPLLRAMYQGLKRNDSHVTIRFFPGGHAPQSAAVLKTEDAWFKAHGLRLR